MQDDSKIPPKEMSLIETALKSYRARVAVLAEARSGIVTAYCETLRGAYAALPVHDQLVILDRVVEGLERVISTIENRITLQTQRDANPFDPEQAKRIRIEVLGKGMSGIKKLAEVIGVHSKAIYRYERGVTNPRNSEEAGPKYLDWLKSKGYDPFKAMEVL